MVLDRYLTGGETLLSCMNIQHSTCTDYMGKVSRKYCRKCTMCRLDNHVWHKVKPPMLTDSITVLSTPFSKAQASSNIKHDSDSNLNACWRCMQACEWTGDCGVETCFQQCQIDPTLGTMYISLNDRAFDLDWWQVRVYRLIAHAYDACDFTTYPCITFQCPSTFHSSGIIFRHEAHYACSYALH